MIFKIIHEIKFNKTIYPAGSFIEGGEKDFSFERSKGIVEATDAKTLAEAVAQSKKPKVAPVAAPEKKNTWAAAPSKSVVNTAPAAKVLPLKTDEVKTEAVSEKEAKQGSEEAKTAETTPAAPVAPLEAKIEPTGDSKIAKQTNKPDLAAGL